MTCCSSVRPRASIGSGTTHRARPLTKSPATKRVLAKLEEPISMAFANRTSLDDVLTYLRQATTTSRGHDGIPIFSDPDGLQEAGRWLSSTVSDGP